MLGQEMLTKIKNLSEKIAELEKPTVTVKKKKKYSSKSSDDSSTENNEAISTETGITDSSQANRTQSANTGDTSNPILWIVLMLFCGAAIGIIVRNKKRNRDES